jgi:shikimate kinase/3-dehydroquinate synthase
VVHVPTTLVAQVDSAYGGKTGVDLPEGKNYAGAYHLPAAVIADASTLRTLSSEELAAGFVEALKTGLLAGGALWERVRAIESLDPDDLSDVVFACARYKCAIVAADERDSGLRNVLNLGHTVGHAIEAASNYSRYRHGEAISIGLLAALRLSEAPELRDECEEILRRHQLPVTLDPAIGVDDVLDALQRDKKRTAAGVGFVLLSEPGQPRTGQIVEPAKVRAAVEELY